MEDPILPLSSLLLSDNTSMVLTTVFAPTLFSSANSLTTVIPSTISLLAPFTCPTVATTRCKLPCTEPNMAPSAFDKWLIATI